MPILILGVDVISENPKRFAVVAWFNGRVEKKGEFTAYRLLRFIRAKRPDIVAFDSIYELGSEAEVRRFIRSLPEGTKLVQVTGKPGEQRPLPNLAKEHGIGLADRFDPYEEAKACALLASKGVGHEVIAFEEETKVIVARGRSQGKGGWSQDRYRRRVHNLVQAKVRNIEEALRRSGIPFDLEVEERDYGLQRGEFRVYAGREELAGIVTPMSGGDVEVRVIPVEREKFDFAPLSGEVIAERRKNVIVGIDPGITVGIGAIDLNGKVVAVHSERNMSVGDIFRFISDVGHPVVVATDVSPAPGLVEKIASSFKAILFIPRESLRVEEKNEIIKSLGVEVDDDHQRDALAAAYKAYLRFKSKLDHVDARLRELGLQRKENEVKALVLQGYNLGEAITKVTVKERPREEPESGGEEKVDVEPFIKRIRELERSLELLEQENRELKKIIAEQRRTIEKLERRLVDYDDEIRARVLRERELEAKVKRIAELERELREAKAIIERLGKDLVLAKRMHLMELRGSAIPLKVLENLTWRDLEELEKGAGLKKGDVVYVVNPAGAGRSIAEHLVERRIRALVCDKELPNLVYETLREAKIPVVDVEVKRVDDFAIADREELEKAIEERLKEWEEEERQKELEKFMKVVEEYKIERLKELKGE